MSVIALPARFVVDTPATRRGSRYAWIPIAAFRDLSAGGLKLLTLLSGLHRPRKAIALTAGGCAESLGCCERSLRYWRRELEGKGWVEPGALAIRRPNRLRKGFRARVDVRKLAGVSPASLRAYVAVAFATRDGAREETYAAIARGLGVSRQALWAALKGVRRPAPGGGLAGGQKATELLRKVLAKAETAEGRRELREERKRRRYEAAAANAARLRGRDPGWERPVQ